MKNPLISIIIPTFNSAQFIEKTLDSIIAQTYTNWECVLVDDGSTDNTIKIVGCYLEKDSRFQSHKRPKTRPKGGNAARNYGFQVSSGDFVNWIDSDDTLHKDFILEKLNAFQTNTDVVISKTVLVNEENKIIRKETRTKLTENVLEDFITLEVSWYICDPLWRKEFLIQNKLFFNEDLLKGQDRDFHIRVLAINPEIKIIDKHLYFYKTTINSISTLNSPKVAFSMLKEGLKRNKVILNYNINNKTKLFLLKQQLRTYSILHKKPNSFNLYIKVFKDLFVFDFYNLVVLIKFSVAIIAFKILNAGDRILKSM